MVLQAEKRGLGPGVVQHGFERQAESEGVWKAIGQDGASHFQELAFSWEAVDRRLPRVGW